MLDNKRSGGQKSDCRIQLSNRIIRDWVLHWSGDV
jgi:hypothetical protein